MAIHIVGTATTPVGPTTPNSPVRAIRITVNNGFTGTITTADMNGTVGIVTTPVVGQSFLYSGLLSPVTVTASAAGDLTVSVLNSHS